MFWFHWFLYWFNVPVSTPILIWYSWLDTFLYFLLIRFLQNWYWFVDFFTDSLDTFLYFLLIQFLQNWYWFFDLFTDPMFLYRHLYWFDIPDSTHFYIFYWFDFCKIDSIFTDFVKLTWKSYYINSTFITILSFILIRSLQNWPFIGYSYINTFSFYLLIRFWKNLFHIYWFRQIDVIWILSHQFNFYYSLFLYWFDLQKWLFINLISLLIWFLYQFNYHPWTWNHCYQFNFIYSYLMFDINTNNHSIHHFSWF